MTTSLMSVTSSTPATASAPAVAASSTQHAQPTPAGSTNERSPVAAHDGGVLEPPSAAGQDKEQQAAGSSSQADPTAGRGRMQPAYVHHQPLQHLASAPALDTGVLSQIIPNHSSSSPRIVHSQQQHGYQQGVQEAGSMARVKRRSEDESQSAGDVEEKCMLSEPGINGFPRNGKILAVTGQGGKGMQQQYTREGRPSADGGSISDVSSGWTAGRSQHVQHQHAHQTAVRSSHHDGSSDALLHGHVSEPGAARHHDTQHPPPQQHPQGSGSNQSSPQYDMPMAPSAGPRLHHVPSATNSLDSYTSTSSSAQNQRGSGGGRGHWQGPSAGAGNNMPGGLSRDARRSRGSYSNLQHAAGGKGGQYQGRNGSYAQHGARVAMGHGSGRSSLDDMMLNQQHGHGRPMYRGQDGAGIGAGQGVGQDPSQPLQLSPESSTTEPRPTTDLERFMVQITPQLNLDVTNQSVEDALRSLCLEDVWRFYLEPSLYGREVYTLGGPRGPSISYFVPYLSAIQLFTPASPKDPGNKRLYICETDRQYWPKHMHLLHEHFETEMPFLRYPLHEQLERLAQQLSKQAAASKPAASTTPAAAAGAAKAGVGTGGPSPGVAVSAADSAATEQARPLPSSESSSHESWGTGQAGSHSGDHDVVAGEAPGSGAPSTPVASARSSLGTSPASIASAVRDSSSLVQPAESQPSTQPGREGSGGGSSSTTAAATAAAEPQRQEPGCWLHTMRLHELHPASWYCVAWYPVYRIPDAPLNVRFLTFHSFGPLIESIFRALDPEQQRKLPLSCLPVHVSGLKWNNMIGERWLEPLTVEGPSGAVSNHQLKEDESPGSYSSGGGGRGRGGRHGATYGFNLTHMDPGMQAYISELQSTAERLARGHGVRVMGPTGVEECRQRHPDYEFFSSRG